MGGGEEKERRTNPEIKNEIIFDVSTLSTLLQTLSLTHYLPPSYSPTLLYTRYTQYSLSYYVCGTSSRAVRTALGDGDIDRRLENLHFCLSGVREMVMF